MQEFGCWLSSFETIKAPKFKFGRAIAKAVSRRLPTAAARVQTRVWSCGILWWTKVVLGQAFSENFGFPCQSTFHLLLHNHLHYHHRPGVAAVPIVSQNRILKKKFKFSRKNGSTLRVIFPCPLFSRSLNHRHVMTGSKLKKKNKIK
jgi:hypothetical protein